MLSRRTVIQLGAVAAAGLPRFAIGQTAKIRIGVMLPFTGTYASLGEMDLAGLKLSLAQHGNKLGGREVEIVTLDDESDPARAPANATKLIKGDNVDILVGTVHSGVEMGIVKVARGFTIDGDDGQVHGHGQGGP